MHTSAWGRTQRRRRLLSLLPRTGLRCTAGPARSRCCRTRRGQTSSTRRCCTSARSGRQPCRMGWNPAPRTGSSGRPGCCRSTHRHTLGQSQGSSSNLHEHMHSKCEQVMEASQPAKHSIAQGAASQGQRVVQCSQLSCQLSSRISCLPHHRSIVSLGRMRLRHTWCCQPPQTTLLQPVQTRQQSATAAAYPSTT